MTAPALYAPGRPGWVIACGTGMQGVPRSWAGPDLYVPDGEVPGLHPLDTAWVWELRREAEAFLRPFLPARTSISGAGYRIERVSAAEELLARDPHGGEGRCPARRHIGALGQTRVCDYRLRTTVHGTICPAQQQHIRAKAPAAATS